MTFIYMHALHYHSPPSLLDKIASARSANIYTI